MADGEPGSAMIQVLVPLRVTGERLGASTHVARGVPEPSMVMGFGHLVS